MRTRTFREGNWRPAGVCIGMLIAALGATVGADDWPEWRGKGRLGLWNETGIVDKFPPADRR